MTSRAPDRTGHARVALDVGPARSPATGVSIYIVELARALERIAPGDVVHIGVRADGPLAGDTPRVGASRMRGRTYLSWLLRRADRDARRAGAGLVHYTNAFAPIRRGLPFVLTIQDLSLIRMPRAHPPARLAAIPVMVAAAHGARFVIVPSEATRDELRRFLRVPDERIVTIPLAARRPTETAVTGDILDELDLAAGRYILTIGTIEPRKNHRRLLAAFERLAAADAGLKLVIVGAPGWGAGDFHRALATSDARDRVVVAGHRPDVEVAELLRHCAVMAYPSTYEGFGLPVVEAMALGVPVVTSRVSSLPEAAGGAAVLVDPYDVASIARGIADAANRRGALVDAGLARVAGRTWLDVARDTTEVYERAQR
jgi:glycosyltransferase involved in cell wall biosynthesis